MMLVDNFVLQENALTLHEYCRPQGRIKRSKHLPLRLQLGVRHSHQENRGLNFCLKSARHLWLINQKMCVIATWIPPFSCHLHLLRRSKHSKHLIPGLWRRSLNYNMIDAILMAGINELLCMKRARQLGLLNQDFLPLFIFVAGI